MRKASIFITLTILFGLKAVDTNAQYWQQKADYLIQVKLIPELNTLEGKLELTYTNNSPNSLDSLYFHCWPNAYSSKQTPFAKQLERSGNLKFRFAKPHQLGKMYGVIASTENEVLNIVYLDDFKELAGLKLPTPLAPNSTIKISLTFNVTVPEMFSRMGHEDEHYCITQWFPKVVKYDEKGWHRMPYLDLGEYYDDFGSYDVYITTPKHYVVAGTGNLLTESEIDWLKNRVSKSEKAKASGDYSFMDYQSDSLKTVHFHEDNVHDFAWFANPKYLASTSTINLDTNQIETWAFYDQENSSAWNRATDFLGQSVTFYSENVGMYPYKTVKAVAGPLNAGSGMEYPTITVIAGGMGAVKRVILHEVGHNWFQGMLGTNERRFPYLDEGFNSYYENRYYFENEPSIGVDKFSDNIQSVILTHLRVRQNDQACNLHSDDYDQLNYGLSIYSKSAENLLFLEEYLGKDVMDSCMFTLFREWQYKHPRHQDFQEVYERVSGKDLDWFFNEMMGSYHTYGYGIKKAKNNYTSAQITINKEGDYTAPFLLSIVDEGDNGLTTTWIEGVKTDTTIAHSNNISRISINHNLPRLESNMNNNYWDDNGKGFKLKMWSPFQSPETRKMTFSPALGYNTSDGNMLGLAIFNPIIPQPLFEYQLLGMYGFGSKHITGLAKVQKNWFWKTDALKKRFHLGLSAKSFGLAFSERIDGEVSSDVFQYFRVQPYAFYKFGPRFKHNISHSFKLRSISRNLNNPYKDDDGNNLYGSFWKTYVDLNYTFKNSLASLPYTFDAGLRGGDGFLQLRAELKGKLPYKENKDIRFRLFGGSFLQPYDQNEAYKSIYDFRLTNQAGTYDYLLDGLAFDRTRQDGFYSRQLLPCEGGFAAPINSFASSSVFGAFNISAALPVSPLRVIFNGAYIPLDQAIGNRSDVLHYELGLQLGIWQDIITINAPFIHSNDINEYLELNKLNFWNQITVSLDLTKLNPIELIQEGAGSLF